ncbi:MAG: hypothetical protein Q8Q88_17785 [Phenylobacterium sp.]|uniref:hypothetical protein n=1 Tax=Phenylobacterium sp. TaxID=1871053 RepID=UPI0027365C50|nr:hypothetical protein [Phenylobacterium sp.]MDP3748893.1 hypothetical protein [Phenylobacterium sp.]
MTFADLTFIPDDDALAALASAWAWRFTEPFEPVLFTAMGDVFVRYDDGEVWWLNTGTAELVRVAPSTAAFSKLLAGDDGDYWLMPGFVEELRLAGKRLEPGCCYSFVTLPIFSEGRYEVANLNPMTGREHFGVTGSLHAQLQALPDGALVTVRVEP